MSIPRKLQRRKARLHAGAWRGLQKMRRLRPSSILATGRWFVRFAGILRRRRQEPILTVAVDISSFWEPLTGIGWYLYRILEHLAHRDDVKLRLYGPVFFDADAGPLVELPQGPAIELVVYTLPMELAIPPMLLHRILHKVRPLLIAADGNRVIFAPNFFLPGQFRLARGKVVATIHDLGFMKVPWTLQQETLRDLDRKLHRSLRQASSLLTPSEAVRREILEADLVAPEEVTAIHHGPGQLANVEPGDLPEGTPERFALHVGTIEPRKNLGIVVKAWKRLRDEGANPPTLVLCGRLGWHAEEILPLLDQGEKEGWLHRFGYVDNPQLAALYRSALFVVFPSVYEGFGLPAVEAQRAETPLICSDIPVLREVAGDAAVFVPPDSPEAWAEAVRNLTDDESHQATLSRLGGVHAATFSWARAAQATLEVWRQAASQP